MSIGSAMNAGYNLGQGIGRRIDRWQADGELEDEEEAGVAIEEENAAYTKQVAQYQKAKDDGFISQEEMEKNTAALQGKIPKITYREGYNEKERKVRRAELYDAQLRTSGDDMYADKLQENTELGLERKNKRRKAAQEYAHASKMNPLTQANAGLTNESLVKANAGQDLSNEAQALKNEINTFTKNEQIEYQKLLPQSLQADIDSRKSSTKLSDQQYTQAALTFGSIQQKLKYEVKGLKQDHEMRGRVTASNALFNTAMAPGEGRREAVNKIMGQGLPMFNDPKFKDSDNSMEVGEDGDYYMTDAQGKRGTNMTETMMNNPEAMMTAQLYAQASITGDPKDLTAWLGMQDKGEYYSLFGKGKGTGKGADKTLTNLVSHAKGLTAQISNLDNLIVEAGDDPSAEPLRQQRDQAYKDLDAANYTIRQSTNAQKRTNKNTRVPTVVTDEDKVVEETPDDKGLRKPVTAAAFMSTPDWYLRQDIPVDARKHMTPEMWDKRRQVVQNGGGLGTPDKDLALDSLPDVIGQSQADKVQWARENLGLWDDADERNDILMQLGLQ